VQLPHALTWLLLPWDGAPDHHLPVWMAWHGRLMVLSWGVLVPAGILVARYFKIWPRQDWPRQLDDQHWWHIHRITQILAICLATLGLWLAWRNSAGQGALANWHGLIGWTIMVIGWGQVAGGLLRGKKGGPTDKAAHGPDFHGDHYDMTLRRVVFEYVHKLGGYAALVLTGIVVPMGLRLADAPRWMWIVIALWWLCLVVVAIRLQCAGRCIDTYQAIWGPRADLPGNQRRPIGWGVVKGDRR
jgi:hypothetical protein